MNSENLKIACELLSRATELFKAQRFDDGFRELEAALNLDPLYPPVISLLRDLYKQLPPEVQHRREDQALQNLKQIQDHMKNEVGKFHPSVMRFLYPNPFFVGLESGLYQRKIALMERIKNEKSSINC